MKLLVCGGRGYNDRDHIWFILDIFKALYPGELQLIQGGAKGADKLAYYWAKEHRVPCRTYEADWNKYGKAAGFIRNKTMLEDGKAEMVLAFPGGRGTQHMVDLARKKGIEIVSFN